MNKNFISKLFFLMMISFMLVIISGKNNSVAHADTSDGPWEMATTNVPVQQQLNNGRTIYYQISNNDPNTRVFQTAVNNWNQLGVIKLVQVNSGDPKAQITMQTKKISKNYATGEAPYDWTIDNSNQSIAYMSNTFVILTNNKNEFNKKDQLITAEHEIGHALGFAHDNRIITDTRTHNKAGLVMNAKTTLHSEPLGRIEQQTLADHYHLQPINGWLNNNY